MRFSASTILAVVAVAAAQGTSDSNGSNPFNIPPEGLNTEAGDTVDLTWQPTTEGTVTIYLRSGASNDLNKGEPIASNIDNSGSFTWQVPDDIVRGSNYALEIVDDSNEDNTNYTPPFVVESDNNAAPSSASTDSSMSMTATDSAMSTMTDASMTDSSMMTEPTDSAMSTMTDASMTDSSMMTESTASATESSRSMTGSMTTSSTASATDADIQATSAPSEGSASRMTTFGGLFGLVALGAIAL